MLICEKCGYNLDDDSEFCGKCGRAVVVAGNDASLPQTGQAQDNSIWRSDAQQYSAYDTQQGYQHSPHSYHIRQAPQKTKPYLRKGTTLTIGICSLALWWIPVIGFAIAAVGLVFGILRKRKTYGAEASSGALKAGFIMSVIALPFALIFTVVFFSMPSGNKTQNNSSTTSSALSVEASALPDEEARIAADEWSC